MSIVGVGLFSAPVAAQSSAAISQGFTTKQSDISVAALVSTQPGNASSVELATSSNVSRLAGVAGQKSLIALSDGSGSVQVVISGITVALVSDINGPVGNGDKITASPIAGVGMKATESTTVVGTAQGSLGAVSTDTRTITAKDGRSQTVHIGVLPLQVAVAYYSTAATTGSTYVPAFLQHVANRLTGKNVSPVRVLVAALILLLLFTSVTVLLYSAVHSSMISIGRNPLAEHAVHKSLRAVGVTIAGILVFAVAVVYVVLTV